MLKKEVLYISSIILFLVYAIWIMYLLDGYSATGFSVKSRVISSPYSTRENILSYTSAPIKENAPVIINRNNNAINNGYLIELKDEPVLKKYAEFKNTIDAVKKTKEYRKNIIAKKNTQRKELTKTLTNSRKIKREYNDVFNGFLIEITPQEVEKIKKLGFVKKIYPDSLVNLTLYESIPLINANDVWEYGYTGKNVTIGIIDTGVDYNHPDLCYSNPVQLSIWPGDTNNDGIVNDIDEDSITKYFGYTGTPRQDKGDISWKAHISSGWWSNVYATYADSNGDGKVDQADVLAVGVNYGQSHIVEKGCNKIIGGYDFGDNDEDFMDRKGHGTHVAGIAAGNGVLKGVAPDVKLYVYKVMDSFGTLTVSYIISAIERSVDPNVDGNYSDHLDIISMSLGDVEGTPDDLMSQAVDNAVNIGIIAVAAAGNDGPESSTIHSPGSARKAISVGATDKNDIIASFSSRGPSSILAVKPDLTAPGVDICSALYDFYKNTYCIDNIHIFNKGTSMATPHVSGAVALLLEKYPDLEPNEIKSILLNNAKAGGYDVFTQGSGRIDILKSANADSIILPNNLQLTINSVSNIANVSAIFEVRNITSKRHIYNISAYIEDSSITVSVNPTIISGTKKIILSFKAIGQSNIIDGVYGGVILFRNLENNDIIRVPYSLVVDTTPPIITLLGKEEIIEGNLFKQYFAWNTDEDTDSTFYYRLKGTWRFLEKYSEGIFHKVNIDDLSDGKYEYFISAVNLVGSKTTVGKNESEGRYYYSNFTKTQTLTIPQANLMKKSTLPSTDIILTKIPEIDMDNDGKKEVVITNDANGGWRTVFYIYESNGNMSFNLAYSNDLGIPNQLFPSDAGDSDKDGKNELLLYFSSSGYDVMIYESPTSSSFPSEIMYSIDTGEDLTSDAKFADLDNDEKKEIVIPLLDKPKLLIYENIGDDSFTKVFEENDYKYLEMGIKSMTLAEDIDSDGRKEVIFGGYNYSIDTRIYIIENNGDNSYNQIWTNIIEDEGRAIFPEVMYLGDLDNDGKKEFIVGGMRSVYSTETDIYYVYKIYESVGDNKFEEVWSAKIINPYAYSVVNTADIDGDGFNEIIIQVDLNVYIFKNRGDNIFEPIGYIISSTPIPVSIGVGDYNNNLKDELLLNNIEDTPLYEN